MSTAFIHSFQSEWLKTKRSLAAWLVVIGGFFIPVIILIGRLINHDKLVAESESPAFWENVSNQCWQLMALFMLPMGVIMAASLITQIEFRNNAWKQLHTTPQYLTTIFFSKLAVILVMMLQFFLLFNIGVYLTGAIPTLVLSTVDYPQQAFPFGYFWTTSAHFFIDCLPIIGLQYLVSMHFKNFLVPLGVGIGVLLASLIAVEWKYGYVMPYTYCPYNFFTLRGAAMEATKLVNIHWVAIAYFAIFMAISYILYITKKERG